MNQFVVHNEGNTELGIKVDMSVPLDGEYRQAFMFVSLEVDEEGNPVTVVSKFDHSDDSATISNVLSKLTEFLRRAGYTWLDENNIVCVTD